LTVFAVIAVNYQPSSSRLPQQSSIFADGNRLISARGWLFRRCSRHCCAVQTFSTLRNDSIYRCCTIAHFS